MGLGVVVDQQKWDRRGWVQDHYKKLKWAYASAKNKMDHAAGKMKPTYDRGAKDVPLLDGQRVWVRDRNRQGRGKLCGWWGPVPHVVIGTLGETGLVYRVRPEMGGKEKVLHRNALKLCIASEVEDLAPPSTLDTTPIVMARDPVPYSIWVAPAPEPVNMGNETVRRSARTNVGQRPMRYRE